MKARRLIKTIPRFTEQLIYSQNKVKRPFTSVERAPIVYKSRQLNFSSRLIWSIFKSRCHLTTQKYIRYIIIPSGRMAFLQTFFPPFDR